MSLCPEIIPLPIHPIYANNGLKEPKSKHFRASFLAHLPKSLKPLFLSWDLSELGRRA